MLKRLTSLMPGIWRLCALRELCVKEAGSVTHYELRITQAKLPAKRYAYLRLFTVNYAYLRFKFFAFCKVAAASRRFHSRRLASIRGSKVRKKACNFLNTCSRTHLGTERYGKVRKGTERYGKVRKGTERYGKVRKGTDYALRITHVETPPQK